MKRLMLSFLVQLLLAIPVYATILNVPSQYTTIQAGIDACVNGDTVLVGPGEYNETISFNGKGLLVESSDGYENTVLTYSNSPIVNFTHNEPQSAVLQGFKIQKSLNNSAVYVAYSCATLRNNMFIDNGNQADGGAINAIAFENSSNKILNVNDNLFCHNATAYAGGAIRAYGIVLAASGNIFYSNIGAKEAGAIHLRANDHSAVHHNLFFNNKSGNMAGAIIFSECAGGSFYNNTVVGNFSNDTTYGAGVVVWGSTNILIFNNIISNNYCKGIFKSNHGTCEVTYNDVWNNNIDYYGVVPGVGSITADPMFAGGDPFSFDLQDQSPCIDAGDPNSPLDPDGTIADMGSGMSIINCPQPREGIKFVPFDYPTISNAILFCTAGDTILVAPGVYHERCILVGKAISIISEQGASNTVLQPDGLFPIVDVYSIYNTSEPLIIKGFSFNSVQNSRTISLDHFNSKIENCIFENNVNNDEWNTGTIYSHRSQYLVLRRNIFRNNSSVNGGAVWTYEVRLYADSNIFIGNTTSIDGGALFVRATDSLEIHHNLIYQNHCQRMGGAIIFSECTGGSLYNNTIVNNSTETESYGGGVVLYQSYDIKLYNNIVASNGRWGFCSMNAVNFPASYNDLFDNSYLNVVPGPGSITADPMFLNFDTFELGCSSPCIDAGKPQTLDPDSSIADMGAVYYPYLQGDVNCSKSRDGIDIVYLVNFIMAGGNSIFPPSSADVNGDCAINSLDISYFVNFLKGYGMAPSRRDCR